MPSNRTFIITGAGKGLGRELSKYAYSIGYSVALVSRTLTDLEKLKDELQASDTCTGRRGEQVITTHVCDLAIEKEVNNTFQAIAGSHSYIRGLINNAGTWIGRAPVETLTKIDVMRSLDLNFFSAFSCTTELLAIHRAKQSGQELSIAFIGATASLQGRKNVAAFCLGKGATRIMAQSLAREVAPDGIHVAHFVLDGLFDNERTLKLNPNMPEDRFMKQSKIAETIFATMLQDRSCWTFETDLRPFNEPW